MRADTRTSFVKGSNTFCRPWPILDRHYFKVDRRLSILPTNRVAHGQFWRRPPSYEDHFDSKPRPRTTRFVVYFLSPTPGAKPGGFRRSGTFAFRPYLLVQVANDLGLIERNRNERVIGGLLYHLIRGSTSFGAARLSHIISTEPSTAGTPASQF